jgi:kumamolisin
MLRAWTLLWLVSATVPTLAQYNEFRALDPNAEVRTHADGTAVVTPSSSFLRPGTGRAHTNLHLFHPMEGIPKATSASSGPPFAGNYNETPASISCIYALVTPVAGCNPQNVFAVPNGGSRVIAIVDAYDAPNALSDLTVFSENFDLPLPNATNFQVVYATSSGTSTTTAPAYDPGWEMEISLDIEWAHAMAPNAKIILVEAQSDSLSDLLAAVTLAGSLVTAGGGGQLSNSWGGTEFSGETSYDSVFTAASVVYFAASGDTPGTSYPAASSNVVAVGGTFISRNHTTGKFLEESAWVDGGGGASQMESRPAYQNSIEKTVGGARGTPDLSAVADPNSGVWIYDSNGGGWIVVGGTSVATPVVAGITNLRGTFSISSNAELTHLYGNQTQYTDIKTGTCGTHRATARWDFCTGVGVPRWGSASAGIAMGGRAPGLDSGNGSSSSGARNPGNNE